MYNLCAHETSFILGKPIAINYKLRLIRDQNHKLDIHVVRRNLLN